MVGRKHRENSEKGQEYGIVPSDPLHWPPSAKEAFPSTFHPLLTMLSHDEFINGLNHS